MKYIIKDSDIHGVGCFATQDIAKGEIVAYEPYFKFANSHKNEVLNDYYWKPKDNDGKIIINGLGNYCNHKNDSNISPILNNLQNSRFIRFIALKDIKRDEELFNNYGEVYWKSRKILKKKKLIQEIKNDIYEIQNIMNKIVK